MKDTKTSKRTAATDKASEAFTAEERAAMQEHVREQKAAARRGPRDARAEGERDVLAKIAEMPEADRVLAERIHAIVTATAPDLSPKTWYGMPAYARDGKVVCFFQSRGQVQGAVRDVRLQRGREPRRWLDVADGVRPDEADGRRRDSASPHS